MKKRTLLLFLLLFDFYFILMDKVKSNTPPVSYTKGPMTCHVLLDEHSVEYIVKSEAHLLGIIDLLIAVGLLTLGWLSILPISLLALGIIGWLLLKYKSIKQESLLVMRDIGVQVKAVYWGGSTVSRFITRCKIEDVIINEGITMWQVKSYIAILVKDQDMVVVFQHLLPSLYPVLLDVYQGTRAVLFSVTPHHHFLNYQDKYT
ncbi:GPI-GlcNAc transferase complex, PIG-H component-domain-containing protein [Spinellus fusiger]|nr:GPI-GlcNAc transferase complex, PIG-H component-domain-containing protein [Spinellus fusiger]